MAAEAPSSYPFFDEPKNIEYAYSIFSMTKEEQEKLNNIFTIKYLLDYEDKKIN